ncbi:uncharacterized protein LOC117321384 isoform X2 [Pecten maximus]|uniref:uncharacterized protein LOC117321384 isoform X2 n=1 Tax=Pecten maximus TaxID=6579 RepID=UPI0014581FC0|nr:uncharacterized protein LOC117321384 isoform X2 [Pecten maximus]
MIDAQYVKDIFVPEIYLFCVRDNSVHIHMELIENVISLRDVMDKICSLYPLYIWPFSRFILLEVLAIVNAMHEQNITHGDLHAANILLQKLSNTNIRIVCIDFGEARGIQKDMEDLAELGTHLETACNSVEGSPSFRQLSESERDELHRIIDMIQMGKSTTDVQRILQKQLNQKDKDKMLQAVISILLSQDPDTSSFKPLGESEQAESLNHDDIQNIPQEEKLRGKDRPLEEDMSKLQSPPDDLKNFQPVHDSAPIRLGSSEMVDSTADTQSNQEIPPAPHRHHELSKSLKIEEKKTQPENRGCGKAIS